MGWVVKATTLPLYPRERPGTHFIGDCLGPRSGLEGCRKSRLHWDSMPGPSSPQRVAIPTELSRPTLPHKILYNFCFCVMFLNNICHCRDLDWVTLNLFLYHEDGGRTFIRNLVNIYTMFYYTIQQPYSSYCSMQSVRTSLRSWSTFTTTCVYRDAPPSSLPPCPSGSDFQVQSISKSAWKCRSGPIASHTC